MDKAAVLSEIKGFLEGYNNDLKYLVNVETDPSTNIAECVIHEPNKEPKIIEVKYEPFMYMKDLSKTNYVLYAGMDEDYIKSKRIKYGITITPLKTGNQKRLVDGYCYKLTSRKSYNGIINYLKDGGLNPYEKLRDENGNPVRNNRGNYVYLYSDLFFTPRLTEQFFISTQSRLYKGFEEYNDVHKLTFDIETTALRYQIGRVFAIGVRNNKGFEIILEAEKLNDDEAEIKLIQQFFNLIDYLRPAVIMGYNSETFDIDFLLGRAKILKMDMTKLPMGLKKESQIRRRANVSVKYGNTADKYTATEMWGYSIIDIIHAVRKTAAFNSDIKATGLKYIAKHEDIAKPDRTYILGEDNTIGKYYTENKVFLIDDKNNYVQIPNEYQEIAKELYTLQVNKDKFTPEDYKKKRNAYFDEDKKFVNWLKIEAVPKNLTTFIGGKNLVKQYLLDDLWETEQVDDLYNQSSFMLAKIIPTTYQRICTMGTAAIWNLLMTAWSYENDIAIPVCDKNVKFSGGLARCYKSGYTKRLIKIDYASLYPMIQLTDDVFPIFDITGVMKKMLLYLTTTRNIYKKIANTIKLDGEEATLLREIDHEIHVRYINNELTSVDNIRAKIKQLPIKTLNNSLFGALGSGIAFNWSDNVCAARITCTGRLHLRHAISWFSEFGCVALLAVTDGINFHYPEKTKIRVTDSGVTEEEIEGLIEEMWQYGGKMGIEALIAKYNKEEMKPPFMSVDTDGESISCLNLSRINYATMSMVKNKKTGEMKEKVNFTGNTIKSKVMPEYIQDFIDKGLTLILQGKGKEFVEYYQDYAENIRYMKIPLKKIASKSRVKQTISEYKKRGKDKNGRDKAMQAHMELLIEKRNLIAEELFEKHKNEFDLTKSPEKLTIDDKMKYVINYMPPEPDLDSVVYYVNTGYRKSHGDSRKIKDKISGEERICAKIIENEDLINNPDLTGEYNYEKYLSAFNNRVESLLVGFEPEIREKILVKIDKNGELAKNEFPSYQLELKNFDLDDYDESMYLEKREAEFWNKTGYDPRLVWDGFKLNENHMVYYEIYQNALDYLNDLMTKSNKPRIKSINSDYAEGDLVLIKDDTEYHVAAYNGVYMQIIRTNVQVPKTEIELELERQREEDARRLKNLETASLVTKTDRDFYLEALSKRRERYFEDFKKYFKIPEDKTMDVLFSELEEARKTFELYVSNREDELEAMEAAYSSEFSDDFD